MQWVGAVAGMHAEARLFCKVGLPVAPASAGRPPAGLAADAPETGFTQ